MTSAPPFSQQTFDNIVADNAPLFRKRGYAVVPVRRGAKRPLIKGWSKRSDVSDAEFAVLIDFDDKRLVPFVSALAPSLYAKTGSKGQTNFYPAVAADEISPFLRTTAKPPLPS